RLGRPMQARYVSPEQLESIRLPVIVHIDGDDSNKGFFFVVLQNQPQQITYLDGPSETICRMDKESFLRRWSGVVAGVSSRLIWAEVAEAGVGVLFGLSLSLIWLRKRNHDLASISH